MFAFSSVSWRGFIQKQAVVGRGRRIRGGRRRDTSEAVFERLESRTLLSGVGKLWPGDLTLNAGATSGNQKEVAMASLTGGKTVVVWRSTEGTNQGDIFARLVGIGGATESVISVANGAGQQSEPAVAALSDGGFVVTWSEPDSNGTGVKALVFDSTGTKKLNDAKLLNQYEVGTQGASSVIGTSDGGFVVTWIGKPQLVSGQEIFVRTFDGLGNGVTNEDIVNTYKPNAQSQPAITKLTGGGFVVTWTGARSDGTAEQDGSLEGIYAQRYSVGGVKVGSEFRVNTTVTGSQNSAAIAGLADGGFIVTWIGPHGANSAVYSQRYTDTGVAVGAETIVSSGPTLRESPAVVGLAGGGYVIAWEGRAASGNDDIYLRYYAANGTIEAEQIAHAVDNRDHDSAALTASSNGGFILSWARNNGSSSSTNWDVLANAYGLTANNPPVVAGPVTSNQTEDSGSFVVDLLSGATDPDLGDLLNVENLVLVSGDDSGVVINGNSLSIGASAYNSLAVGESVILSYSYSIVDGKGGSVTQTATITITGVNDGPTVNGSVSASGSEDEPGFVVDLLQGATDPDTTDVLSITGLTLLSGNASGVTVVGNSLSVDPGSYNYLAVGENVTITYGYSIVDGKGGSVARTATITITGANDLPTVSQALAVNRSEDVGVFSVDLLLGATDDDLTDTLSVTNLTLLSGDASGVTWSGGGLSVDASAYNYLAFGESAIVTYTYTISDGKGGSVEQTATITIDGVNDAPVASDGSGTVTEDGSFEIDLRTLVIDPESDSLTFQVTGASHGTVQLLADGFTARYTPGAVREGAGLDTFGFTVADNGSPTLGDSGSVAITITPAVGEGEISFVDGILRIGGTSGNDVIIVSKTFGYVWVNGTYVTDANSNLVAVSSITEVKVWGRAGDDSIWVYLPTNSYQHGGSGDDILVGGSGDDLLVGGEGHDLLTGSAGNDLLIGGEGSDVLIGSAGDDILSAAMVSETLTAEELRVALANWAAQPELNDLEEIESEVLDDEQIEIVFTGGDGSVDLLNGSAGADWFILSLEDLVAGKLGDGDLATYV